MILRSTITSVGSTTVYSKNNKYRIQQSIGQSGIIGKKKLKNSTVQQGFLYNTKTFNINNSNNDLIKETLEFVISPNPFVDHIVIKFSKKTAQDIYIKIYDVNGKIHYSNKYPASKQIIVPMNRYSIGAYLIKIESGQKIATKKIIKTI
jgi:hypothetical protein